MTKSVFDCQAVEGAKEMCSKMSVPYAGQIPMDRDLLIACESGKSLASVNPDSPALREFDRLIDDILLRDLRQTNGCSENDKTLLSDVIGDVLDHSFG